MNRTSSPRRRSAPRSEASVRLLIRFEGHLWRILVQKPNGWMEDIGDLSLSHEATPESLAKHALRVCRMKGIKLPSQPEILIDPMPEIPYDSTDVQLRDVEGRVVAEWSCRTKTAWLKPPIVDHEERIEDVCRAAAVDLFLEASAEFDLDLVVARASDQPQQFVASVSSPGR